MRINRGRGKITMAKMQNDTNLQVTFSKRRTGLFKKSSELVTFCGVKMLLIINSPKGKRFSFGNPSVGEIADRFMRTHGFSSSGEVSHGSQVSLEGNKMLNAQLTMVQEQLDVEISRAKEMNEALEGGRDERWWEGSVEGMSYQQLMHFNEQLMNVKAVVAQKMYEISNPLHLLATTSSVFHGDGNAPPNSGHTGPYYMGPTGYFRGWVNK